MNSRELVLAALCHEVPDRVPIDLGAMRSTGITILCGSSSHAKRAMIREIEAESPIFQNIPIYLSRFRLLIWETDFRDS